MYSSFNPKNAKAIGLAASNSFVVIHFAGQRTTAMLCAVGVSVVSAMHRVSLL
jgi:hypothetical protein